MCSNGWMEKVTMKWKSNFVWISAGDFMINSLTSLTYAIDGNTLEVYKRIMFTRYITDCKGEEV
jgi:hypothetical protein